MPLPPTLLHGVRPVLAALPLPSVSRWPGPRQQLPWLSVDDSLFRKGALRAWRASAATYTPLSSTGAMRDDAWPRVGWCSPILSTSS